MKTISITTLALLALTASAASLQFGRLNQQEPLTILDDTPVPGNSPVKLCSSPSADLVEIKRVDLTPSVPQRGQNLTVDAEGTVKQRIEEGAYVLLDVKWGMIKLIHQKVDFCEQLKEVNETCPLEKGVMKVYKEVAIPQQVPPGTFDVHAEVFTKDDVRITCITAKVTFPRGS